jgi:leucyl aminopeptidase
VSIEIKLVAAPLQRHACDLLAVCVRETAFAPAEPRLKALDKALKGLLAKVAAEEEFKGREGQTLLLHTHGKLSARRLLLVGLGKERGVDRDLDSLRQAASRAVKASRPAAVKTLGLSWPAASEPLRLAREAQALVEGGVLGGYRFDKYLKEKKPLKLASLRLLIEADAAAALKLPDVRAQTEAAAALGLAIAEATCAARDLVNEPPGRMTPRALAEAAEAVAKQRGLEFEVHGRGGIEKLGMNLFLAVSQGSEEKPQLVKLSWIPKGEAAKSAPLALVGKAITFDSGGLSLKTAQGMEDMKVDMGGAAAVIGAMDLVGQLQPPFPVHGFFGACENMPSGGAYKPGDVVTGKNGTTVEILNTDAEGRLVLADVLAWAVEHEPQAIIDLATLTGAVMVALGPWTAGLFSNDEGLAGDVLAAASAAGEPVWRLPLPPEMEELIKSPIADLKNTGGRYGGSINAALFLQRFVGKCPWVHLDIAGPASIDKERGYNPRGGTGTGVRLLAELVRRKAALHLTPG